MCPAKGGKMKLFTLRSNADYLRFQRSEANSLEKHWSLIQNHIPSNESEFYVKGFSYTANQQVDFICDFKYSDGFPNVNWRERLVCPKSHFNNRTRFSIHLADTHLNLFSDSNIYIMEKVTPLYEYFSSSYKNTIGSEYLGTQIPLGSVNEIGIRNEDATCLTFQSETFDAILSFDVLEHIPDFFSAFRECYRVLKKNGHLMLSVPFNVKSERNLIRAINDKNGNTTHILPPEYHGDPIGSGGILCYQHFGWEIVENLKKAGFEDAYAVIGWAEEFGYFTPQIQFFAVK